MPLSNKENRYLYRICNRNNIEHERTIGKIIIIIGIIIVTISNAIFLSIATGLFTYNNIGIFLSTDGVLVSIICFIIGFTRIGYYHLFSIIRHLKNEINGKVITQTGYDNAGNKMG